MALHRISRRDLLRFSGVALAGFAGCAEGSPSGYSSPNPDTQTPSPTAIEREYPDTQATSPTATEREYQHIVDEPETSKVYNSAGEPAIKSSTHTPERDHRSSGGVESSASWAYEDWLVSSPNDRDALEFSPETAGVEAAKAFVAETDLSEQTLFVRQYRVSDCISVALDQIKWNEIRGDFEVRLEYSDSLKNENCEDATAHEAEDQKDIEAIIARIPLEEVDSISIMA